MAGDIIDYDYLFSEQVQYDEAAFEKRIRGDDRACELLASLRQELAKLESFDAATVEAAVNHFCETAGIRLRDIIHAIRIATTGKTAGFGMFETLAILGRDRVLQRIDAALQHAQTG
jgi:glutamyl-tRNA synthetase